MPDYDYTCEACRKSFTVHQSYEEHDSERVKCPKCGSLKVQRVLAAVFAKTSKKS
jgi:putative FmdB family regulatory protein